jgi:uncharacterized Rmd1/YagE family protein
MASTATESSPLLPQTNSSSTSQPPPPKPQRTVTFNPLTTVSTPGGPNSTATSLRPLATSPPSALIPAQNVVPPTGQPMLSALNSKLRRRNSHGAPFSTTVPVAPAPKPGAQRTTKTAQKLKLLPNTDPGDDGPDEESGRDVYSQFTRIKDPTARRDAARLGKADRDRLPRVTAYCTANSYRLDGLMKFLKSRAKTRGANPKLFDECIYSTYNYNHLDKQKGRRTSPSSHKKPPLLSDSDNPSRLSVRERRYSDSAVEVEDNTAHRREDLIDLHSANDTPVPSSQVDPTTALSNDSSSTHPLPSTSASHFSLDGSTSSDSIIPEVFLFNYGTVVIWGMTPTHESRFLSDISKFATESLPPDSCQIENFNYYYTRDYQARIYNDFISLRDPKNHMIKLAISHALSQSVKTSLFEDLVSTTIEATSPLPALIAEKGSVNLTRRQINMQIGELFILRINIHLQGSVLDSPELMWAEPQLEPVYSAMRSYLEMDRRVELLMERLSVIGDLLAVLKDQLSHRHGEYLEWIGM